MIPFHNDYLQKVDELQRVQQQREMDLRYWHHRAKIMKQALEDILRSPCGMFNEEAEAMREIAREALDEKK